MNFTLMKIYSGKNLFLPAKTIFASAVFITEKRFFPQNLPTLNLTEGTSKEDLMGLCQGGYGEFWPLL